MAPNAKYIQQSKYYHHDHRDIEDFFDLPIHRDVGVDEPEQNSDNDESDDNCN
jgi:hypothetical protein